MTQRAYQIEDDDLQRIVTVLNETVQLRLSTGQGIESRLLQALAADLDEQHHAYLISDEPL